MLVLTLHWLLAVRLPSDCKVLKDASYILLVYAKEDIRRFFLVVERRYVVGRMGVSG